MDIVGCYLALDNTSTIESVVAALKKRVRGAGLLVVGNFPVNVSEPEGDQRGEGIAAAIATEGLEDMLMHFLPRRSSWCWDGKTWILIR